MQAYPNYSQPMMNPYQNSYNPMLSPQQRLMQMEQQYTQFYSRTSLCNSLYSKISRRALLGKSYQSFRK